MESRERQVSTREKDMERKCRMAEEQLAKAEKMMADFKRTSTEKAPTTERVPVPPTVPPVPMFDKENADVSGKDGKDASGKPLQPLHNIYERREKLLARLLNHKIGTA